MRILAGIVGACLFVVVMVLMALIAMYDLLLGDDYGKQDEAQGEGRGTEQDGLG